MVNELRSEATGVVKDFEREVAQFLRFAVHYHEEIASAPFPVDLDCFEEANFAVLGMNGFDEDMLQRTLELDVRFRVEFDRALLDKIAAANR